MRLGYFFSTVWRNKLRGFLTAASVGVAVAGVVTLSLLSDAISAQVDDYVLHPSMTPEALFAFPNTSSRVSDLNYEFEGILEHYELAMLIGELNGQQLPYLRIYRDGHETIDWLGVRVLGKVEPESVYFNEKIVDRFGSFSFLEINHSELDVSYLDRWETSVGCVFMEQEGELVFKTMRSLISRGIQHPSRMAFSDSSGYRVAGVFEVEERSGDFGYTMYIQNTPMLVFDEERFPPNVVLMRIDPSRIRGVMRDFEALNPGFRAFSFYEQYDTIVSQVEVVHELVAMVSVVVAFLALMGMGLALLVLVNERRREIALMKVFGFSDLQIIWLFFPSNIFLCVLGFFFGISLSAYLVDYANQHMLILPELFNVRLVLETPVLLKAFFYALLMGVVSGFFPYVKVKHIDAASVLKE